MYFIEQMRFAMFDLTFNILICSICERVAPRFAHANAAVVLSAVKVKFGFHRNNDIVMLQNLLELLHELNLAVMYLLHGNIPEIKAVLHSFISSVKPVLTRNVEKRITLIMQFFMPALVIIIR